MTPPPLSEKQFQSLVLELAATFGFRWYHTYRSRKSPTGFPDLVLVRDRVIFAELKSDTGKPTKDQQAWLDALTLAGAEAYLWRPDDLQTIAETFARRIIREPAQQPFFDTTDQVTVG